MFVFILGISLVFLVHFSLLLLSFFFFCTTCSSYTGLKFAVVYYTFTRASIPGKGEAERQVVSTGERSLFRRYYKEGFVLTERGLQEKVWFFLTHSGIVCMCVGLFYYSWDSEKRKPAILVWT